MKATVHESNCHERVWFSGQYMEFSLITWPCVIMCMFPQVEADEEFDCFAALLGPPGTEWQTKALMRVQLSEWR